MRVYVPAAVALIAAVGLLGARIAAAPPATAARHAIAPAPGGALYVADARRGFLVVDAGGTSARIGDTPSAAPLALAADGRVAVLGDGSGAWVTVDGGHDWRAASVPATAYVGLAVSGDSIFAGGWTGGLWRSRDGGAGWQRIAPFDQVEAVSAAGALVLVATLLGGWMSTDGGQNWVDLRLPPRLTAVDASAGLLAAWDGEVFATAGGDRSRLPAGVWALTGGLAATVSGLAGAVGDPLRGREVSALVSGPGALYAGIAFGPVLGSGDGGATWKTLVQP